MSIKSSIQLLFNRRMAVMLLLGIVSGLPLALTSSTLQAWFAVENISVVTIGLLGLIGQPYVFKFVWSPLLDRHTLPFLGRRRGWMVVTQLGLLASISGMAILTPHSNTDWLVVLALVTAVLSASQDISIDAYRTEVLQPAERGFGSALFVCGYRIGMLLSGAIALILAERLGWRTTYFIMASLMIVGMICSWLGPVEDNTAAPPSNLKQAIIEPIREFAQRNSAFTIIVFILLYKLGDALIVNLNNVFFLRELGFTLTTVGVLNKGVGLFSTIVGSFIGAIILAKLRLFYSLLGFGILQSLSIFSYLLLAVVGKSFLLLAFVIGFENFCAGLIATALVSLLMGLCDHRYTATQFALLTAVYAIARTIIGPILAAAAMDYLTWPTIFCLVFLASLPCLLLLWRLRKVLN